MARVHSFGSKKKVKTTKHSKRAKHEDDEVRQKHEGHAQKEEVEQASS